MNASTHTAGWSGPFFTISVRQRPPLEESVRLWIKDLPDRAYDWDAAQWKIPIDIVTPNELQEWGIMVSDPLPPVPLAPVLDTGQPLVAPRQIEPYQLDGVTLLQQGRRLLADEPGVGKTMQLVTFGTNTSASRVLFVVPRLALTDPWESTLADQLSAIGPTAPTQGSLTIIAGKHHHKRLDSFNSGVLLTTDSAISSSPELVKRIIQWRPELMLVDETHYLKKFDSRKARHIRAIASRVPVVIAATGTPYLKDFTEILTSLVITGSISRFGGLQAFLSDFTWEDQWHQRKGLKRRTAEVSKILDDSVWIRRTKQEALPHLPPKVRRVVEVKIDRAIIHRAEDEVNARIDKWIDDYYESVGLLPTPDDARLWVKEHGIESMTQLRLAAGMSKVPEALRRINRWMEKHPDRPLVVWGYFQEVIVALSEACTAAGHRVGVLDGRHTRASRVKTAQAFQNGELDLIIASIPAAGTAITLTRGSDVVFVEIDWTPDVIVQAEDRCHRYGQQNPVNISMMVALGSLDEHIRIVLERKIQFLNSAISGDHKVAVRSSSDESSFTLLTKMVNDRIRQAADITDAVIYR